MAPPPSFRLPRAAWIMARAFTPNLIVALLALPWTVVMILPGMLRKGLFIDPTGTGMVMLYRSRMLLDLLILLPLMMVLIPAIPSTLMAVLPARWGLLACAAILLALVVGFLPLLPREGGSVFPWGPETPKGQRWEIAGLAQLPGTHLTAIQLALRVIDTVPPAGAVIVATAGSARLFDQYQRFGFTPGPKHRVHKVIG